ncbi:MAG: hypothetical protein KAV42_05655 [Candidatus Krumholzibacteria bacterium]|nr:hypothetical protein [Candidatus Krumholzibacteria bacterium]
MDTENGQDQPTKKGGGYFFWGVVFCLLGVMAMFRKMLVIAGIPLWATSFLLLGLSNFLKAPRILAIIDPSGHKTESICRTATIINIFAITLLVFSLIKAF